MTTSATADKNGVTIRDQHGARRIHFIKPNHNRQFEGPSQDPHMGRRRPPMRNPVLPAAFK